MEDPEEMAVLYNRGGGYFELDLISSQPKRNKIAANKMTQNHFGTPWYVMTS
jgi:hypothetical protein